MVGNNNNNNPPFTLDAIPSQAARVILVTGGNAGLGKATITALARHGAKLYMASRSESKALSAIEEIKAQVPAADITFLPLDLSSFASISATAAQFHALEPRLHVLINNAGLMAPPTYTLTADGYEQQLGTNHLGHYLLTKLLLPALQRAAEAGPPGSVRIVNVASIAHQMAVCGLDLENLPRQLERANTWMRYSLSKLANIQHARALAKRYPDIVSVSAHPGVVASNLYSGGGNVFSRAVGSHGKSVETGSLCQLCCAVGERVGLADNGEYFVPPGKKAREGWLFEKGSRWCYNEEASDKLWEWSEKEVAKHGY